MAKMPPNNLAISLPTASNLNPTPLSDFVRKAEPGGVYNIGGDKTFVNITETGKIVAQTFNSKTLDQFVNKKDAQVISKHAKSNAGIKATDVVEVLVFLHSKKNSNIIVEIFSQVLFINKRIAVVTHNISGLDSCIGLGVLRNDLSILLVNELIQGLAVECLSHNFSSLSDVDKSLVAPDVVHTAGFGLPHKVGQRSWVEVRRGWKANGEVIRGHFGHLELVDTKLGVK
jgi:hypothetical protein